MSSKFDKYITDPVVEFVDDDGVVQRYEYHPPQLDEMGKERVSDTSLVAVADLRPMTLGERVRRYMRDPKFQQDLINNTGLDENDDIPDTLDDPDGVPMSPHEERAYELRDEINRKKQQKVEDDKKAQTEAEIAEEKRQKELFRKRMKELREEGAIPD